MRETPIVRRLQDRGGNTSEMRLDNALKMQALLGCPDTHYRIVHVAGTNGKGTVCTKIAACLQHQGYRTGVFTSPHIRTFHERIQINGEPIPEDALQSIASSILDLADARGIVLTGFEAAALTAFVYFKEKNVDWAVLETGLGGRLDATNIVHPELSVITSIGLDHTHVLGETLEAIAEEKAGIIKPKSPILIGPTVPKSVINAAAKKNSSPVHTVSDTQDTNTALARAALNLLGIPADITPLSCTPPCRFQQLEGADIVIDVAHNPAGLCYLFNTINKALPKKPIRALFGLSHMKDTASCIKVIQEHAHRFHAVQDGKQVCLSPKAIANRLPGCNPHDSVNTGVAIARQAAAQNKERLVICGSFYIMKEVLGALEAQILPKPSQGDFIKKI